MKVASFFSGIGGFDVGFELTGMEVVFQCEKKAFGRQVLKKHWPKVPLYEDINLVPDDAIPESDLWCAGFPCQDVSLANNGKRLGLRGERSGLFFRFAQLVKQRRPSWIVLENVPGLLSSQKGEDFRVVVQTLDEFGYGLAWRVLDAKFFGTPQRRRRVFIVASYRSECSAQVLFDDEPTSFITGTSIGAEHIASNGPRRSDQEATIYSIQHAAIGRIHTAGPQSKGYRSDGETWNLDSRGSADAICAPDDPYRVREAAGFSRRLDRSRYTSIGNAVPVPVVVWLGRRIMAIEEQSTIDLAESLIPSDVALPAD